jgi:hypothetical protein
MQLEFKQSVAGGRAGTTALPMIAFPGVDSPLYFDDYMRTNRPVIQKRYLPFLLLADRILPIFL